MSFQTNYYFVYLVQIEWILFTYVSNSGFENSKSFNAVMNEEARKTWGKTKRIPSLRFELRIKMMMVALKYQICTYIILWLFKSAQNEFIDCESILQI